MYDLKCAYFDLDSFFASVEEKHRGLRGVPLVVGGSAERRGAVTSANREARKLGVRAGESIAQIERRWGGRIKVCPVRFELYSDESEHVMEVLRSSGVSMHQSSIDEASLDLSGVRDSIGGAWQGVRFSERLRREVYQTCGLSISVGVSRGRVSAKMAVEEAKPDGLRAVGGDEFANWWSQKQLREIPGVGPHAQGDLARRGFYTIEDVMNSERRSIEKVLGVSRGGWLWDVCHGDGDTPTSGTDVAKTRSVSAEHTLLEDARSVAELSDVLDRLSADVSGRLLEQGEYARGVRIVLRDRTGRTVSRQRRVSAVREYPLMRAVVAELAEELWGARTDAVRLVGVGAYDLTTMRELTLFDDLEGEREELQSAPYAEAARVGELWTHPVFGEGLVVRVEEQTLVVAFPDGRRHIDLGVLRTEQ
jgi:DNA polymerase-4